MTALRKTAVLSMDVEDWYHLDYFGRGQCNENISMLDGVERYLGILAQEHVPSSFFVLGELAGRVARLLNGQPDVGAHGWSHRRPLTMSVDEFAQDALRTRRELEDRLGREVVGYRAPCFSMDRKRLDRLQELGYNYDSSRIDFAGHPLYGTLDMSGFDVARPWIYQRQSFLEFEISSLACGRRRFPVAGGGYLRLLPWPLMRFLLTRYLRQETFYVLYIHPFELSTRPDPPLPTGTPRATRVRFSRGRHAVAQRLRTLIAILRKHGFTFSTFASVRQELLSQQAPESVI